MKQFWLTFLAATALASAGEFKPGQVPAGSQWFAHFDAAAFKRSEIGKFGLEQAKAFAPAIDGLVGVLQFDPRKDLHGVTVFGVIGDGEPRGTVLVDATFKRDHLLTLLRTNESFKEEQTKGHTIFSWAEDQGDGRTFGAFSGKNHVLLGDDRALLVRALDTLAGKIPGLKAAQLDGLDKGRGNYFIAQARTDGLPFPSEAKIVEHVRRVGITVGEAKNNLVVSVRVKVGNDEVGTLVRQAAEGLVAAGRLQLWEPEDPNLKQLEAILREVEIVKEKNTVITRLVVPVKQLLDLARE